MDIHQNLELFRELMLCDGSIYSWCYEANGNLLYSNCPDQIVLAPAFEIFGCLGKMLEIGKTRSNPAFLSSEMGLVWGVAFEKSEDVLYRCHVIGPVFSSAISVDTIFHTVMSKDLSAYSTAWVQRFREALYQVPTSQYTIFSRNLRLLHYCVTGKRIEISEIYADIVDLKSPRTDSLHRDRH